MSGGPGLAFETWVPCNRSLMETAFKLYPRTNRRVPHICPVLADVGFRNPTPQACSGPSSPTVSEAAASSPLPKHLLDAYTYQRESSR
jgi:hypothetical protein